MFTPYLLLYSPEINCLNVSLKFEKFLKFSRYNTLNAFKIIPCFKMYNITYITIQIFDLYDTEKSTLFCGRTDRRILVNSVVQRDKAWYVYVVCCFVVTAPHLAHLCLPCLLIQLICNIVFFIYVRMVVVNICLLYTSDCY